MATFTKMHGLGNDYICINCLENILAENKLPQIARYMCNRNFGIGADGLILVQESSIADIKMRIFSKDGSEAEMCGNGIRCFAKYVREEGLTPKDVINIETLAGIKEVKVIYQEFVNKLKPDVITGFNLFFILHDDLYLN